MLDQRLPDYICEKKNIIRLVTLTALFALVFINIYKPFSSSSWYPVSDFKFFVFSSLIILTGVLVVVISRLIMYYWSRMNHITYGQYAVWILLEIFFMSLFYTIYTLSVNPEREWLGIFKESSVNTALVLLLPYAAIHLYLSYLDGKKQLKLLESRQQAEEEIKQNSYFFYDEKNELRLSIKRETLLYIEAADNYVYIWYLNKEQPTKFVLRNTLKSIETTLRDTSVIRCHRSYMVNFEQVKVLRKGKEGIYLELAIEKVPDIPISKTYSEKVMKWVMNYSA